MCFQAMPKTFDDKKASLTASSPSNSECPLSAASGIEGNANIHKDVVCRFHIAIAVEGIFGRGVVSSNSPRRSSWKYGVCSSCAELNAMSGRRLPEALNPTD